MGYTAVNIGPYDIAEGIQFLQKYNTIPWVSCNFYTMDNIPVFDQYILAGISSIKVGITGVTISPDTLEDPYLFKDWQESLPAVLTTLRKSADFIVVLSALPEKENVAILESYPEIRLLISANPSRPNLQPKRINNGLITQTANQGRYLGQIKIKDTDKQTAQHEIRFIPLKENLPEDKEINKLIDEINHNIQTFNIRKTRSFRDKQLFFSRSRKLSGAEVCKQCHPSQYTFWQSTSHFRSLDSLKTKNEDYNGDCLPCHITQNPEEFMTANNNVLLLFREKPDLNKVGCESCHGAGRVHSGNNEIKMAENVSEQSCLHCHTPERDDSFVFTAKREDIACPSL